MTGPPASEAYPHLFSPLTVGAAKLKNRVVHAAMTTQYAVGGKTSARLIAYHANRARGGAAMTVSEPLAVHAGQVGGRRVDVFSGGDADGLARWAAAVEAHDCRLLAQLQDHGRGRHEDGRPGVPIGPSALPDDLSGTVPHALTAEEIERLIAEMTTSSRRLQAAGFAGVEISAGHGHLFHQFLSPAANRREDAWGGDLAGRARLITDLVAAIRQTCGAGFVIGVKLPGEDGVAGGVDLAEAERITAYVHATNQADYFTWCWGAHSNALDRHLPDLHGARAPYVDKIARLARAAPGTPAGALGLITDPNEAERIVRDGRADLVMLGRPLVTDPAWPAKARAGREAEIRYCVSCNTCWHLITTHAIIACDNNPRVGAPDEADWRPSPAARRRRIVVVGAGPAGMEAAWTAAARGHEVIVLGASDETGGKTRLHATLPGGENLSSVYDFQRLAAERHGARLRLGALASAADVLALEPDAVVLATGSTLSWPAFLSAQYRGEGVFPDIREAVALFAGRTARQSGTVLIHDQDHTAFTYAAVEFLLDRFERAVVVTPRERLANAESLVNRQGIQRRLTQLGVRIVTLHEPIADAAFDEGAVTLENVFTGERTVIEDVALLTFATARVANDALAAPLRAAGLEVRLIGDCLAPRFLLNATAEGAAAGEAV